MFAHHDAHCPAQGHISPISLSVGSDSRQVSPLLRSRRIKAANFLQHGGTEIAALLSQGVELLLQPRSHQVQLVKSAELLLNDLDLLIELGI